MTPHVSAPGNINLLQALARNSTSRTSPSGSDQFANSMTPPSVWLGWEVVVMNLESSEASPTTNSSITSSTSRHLGGGASKLRTRPAKNYRWLTPAERPADGAAVPPIDPREKGCALVAPLGADEGTMVCAWVVATGVLPAPANPELPT